MTQFQKTITLTWVFKLKYHWYAKVGEVYRSGLIVKI